MPSVPLENAPINIRLKLALLWIATMLFYIYGDYFALYIPEEAGKLVSGDTLLNTPIKLFGASVLMSIPPLVIVLTAFASPKLAKIFNIIFGIIYTAIMILIAVTTSGEWWIAYKFYAIAESVLTIIIIWQAFKWPKVN